MFYYSITRPIVFLHTIILQHHRDAYLSLSGIAPAYLATGCQNMVTLVMFRLKISTKNERRGMKSDYGRLKYTSLYI